ncbi:diguanylate cyclase [Demequina sp. B12]|uniref:diguanylate cyclase n=1 Tax=Demequina sp. B12 TaxID=2992757 RepID=UPI00237ABFE5|nr:diguanylate cyclase [Demequina sp. B12]MDE0573293.1 diguanylate cyclase [Demequina sp. B12]
MSIKRRWRLTKSRGYLLALVLIASIAVVQGAATVFFAVAADRQLERAAQDTYSYVGDLTLERVARYADLAESAVVTTALQMTRGSETPDDVELVGAMYQRMLALPDVRAMYVGWPDGRVALIQRDGGGYLSRYSSEPGEVTSQRFDALLSPLTDPEVIETDYDPRTRPWYEAGIASRTVEWTDPYVDFIGRDPLVSVAIAARETPSSDPIAVIGADLSLDTLGDVLDDLPVGAGAEAFVLSEDSQLIAVPSEYTAAMMEWVVESGQTPHAADLGIDVDPPPPGRDQTRFTVDGDQLILDQTFPADDNVDWYIHMASDDAALSSGLGDTRNQLAWIAAYSLLATILAAVLVWRVRRPLKRLRENAVRDDLTGLVKRSEFRARASRLMDRASEHGDAVVITALDLDNFKALNDTAGHEEGDKALVAAATAMRASTRGRDVASRFGGDEFVMAHSIRHRDDAWGLVERLRDAVESAARSVSPAASSVGVTAGFAVIEPGERGELEDLLTLADARLVEGKRTTKGRVYGDGSAASDLHQDRHSDET